MVSNKLLLINLLRFSKYSAEPLFFLNVPQKLNSELFFSICIYRYMGTIYKSNASYYCVPERKLPVWAKVFFQ